MEAKIAYRRIIRAEALSSAEEEYSPEVRALSIMAFRLGVCGAETRLIVQTVERLALAFGLHDINVAVLSQLIVIYSDKQGRSFIKAVKFNPGSINMHNLTSLIWIRIKTEKNHLSPQEVMTMMDRIQSYPYSQLLTILSISIASGAFAMLNGGSLSVASAGVFAGALNMSLKIYLTKKRIFSIAVFLFCGFLGPLSAFLIYGMLFDNVTKNEAFPAMLASVLLLVPGFPYINGILDVFKGFYEPGVFRLLRATILLASGSVGFLFALELIEKFS